MRFNAHFLVDSKGYVRWSRKGLSYLKWWREGMRQRDEKSTLITFKEPHEVDWADFDPRTWEFEMEGERLPEEFISCAEMEKAVSEWKAAHVRLGRPSGRGRRGLIERGSECVVLCGDVNIEGRARLLGDSRGYVFKDGVADCFDQSWVDVSQGGRAILHDSSKAVGQTGSEITAYGEAEITTTGYAECFSKTTCIVDKGGKVDMWDESCVYVMGYSGVRCFSEKAEVIVNAEYDGRKILVKGDMCEEDLAEGFLHILSEDQVIYEDDSEDYVA